MIDNNYNIKILYVGKNENFISQLSSNSTIELINKENGLLAMNWITNNHFDNIGEGKIDFFINKYECPEFDVLICDTFLQGMNAFDLIKEIKKISYYVYKPIIMVSNKFNFQIRNHVFERGLEDYYSLPIEIDILIERIIFLIQYKKDLKESRVNTNVNIVKPYKTKLIKRIFDISMASIALIILSPLLIFIAIAIRVESKGKIYYISKRVGANYKIFDFYKFRSMYPDADKRIKELEHLNAYAQDDVDEENCHRCAIMENNEKCSPIVYFDGDEMCEYMAIKKRNARKAFLKIVNDPRITKIGKFIRNTSIDELPQLINILKGDMSIVGNRPLPVTEAEAITKQGWGKRFQASAGLTGLWQVELRGQDGLMSEEERFILDNKYADNNSFWGDIKLIFKTLKIFIQKENV